MNLGGCGIEWMRLGGMGHIHECMVHVAAQVDACVCTGMCVVKKLTDS